MTAPAAGAGPLAPLRYRRFAMLWTGRVASRFGSATVPVALTLAVIGTGGSAADLGIVLTATAATEIALLLPAGVWADRLSRRWIMIGADTARAIAQLVIGVEIVGGRLDVVHLAVAGAVCGAGNALFVPAATGLVPGLVPRSMLSQANALLSIARRGAMVAGPAIATLLVLTVGAGWVLVLDGLTYALSAVLLLLLGRLDQRKRPRESFRRELVQGWWEVRRRRWYWTNLGSHAVWNIGRSFFLVLGPVLVVTGPGGEVAWGVVAQVAAIGSLVGAVLSLRLRGRRPLVVANVCMALGGLPLAFLAAGADPVLVAIGAGLSFSALGVMGTIWDTVVQTQVPEELLGRVSAWDWLTGSALAPLGLALAAPVATLAGTTPTLWVAAVLVTASSLGVLLVPEVRRMTDEPLGDRPGTTGAEHAAGR